MTLTELLVVIMILTMLLGAALPIMRTAVEGRAMREAARQVNTYVQLARSRAAETGRPVGLWLETEDLPEGYDVTPSPPANTTVSPFARQLFLAETPPPYAGDVVGARIRVNATSIGNDPVTSKPWYRAQLVIDATATPPIDQIADSANFFSLVKVEDRIKFDYKGPTYRIAQLPPACPAWTITFERETNQPAPSGGDLKYQVFRAPQKSSGTPLQLSAGAVIDLTNSGAGLTGREFRTANTPVVILFNPNGSVERVMGGGSSLVPTATIHLLVGSLANLMEAGSKSTTTFGMYNRNLEDMANLWVSIGHQTGHPVTTDNGWQDNGGLDLSIASAREFAQSALAKGGR